MVVVFMRHSSVTYPETKQKVEFVVLPSAAAVTSQ